MPTSLQLKKMTFIEKIQTMELLQDDLCQQPDKVESPNWHLDTLKYRQRLIKEGKAEYLNWEDVKKEINYNTDLCVTL